jgi:hypothetical protein
MSKPLDRLRYHVTGAIERGEKTAITSLRVKCTDCEALVINGLPCHETGCPAAKRPWVEWNGLIVPGDLPCEIYEEE